MTLEAEIQEAPAALENKVDILLVDDMPEKLVALESVLAELNQNIVKARSGREALRLLLQKDFAVILLDVNMPGMDGFETASLIRQRKSSETTPIIFVTAVGGTEIHQARGYSLGAVDYIFSPIVPEVLKTKVGVFVELHKKNLQVKRLNDDLKKYAQSLEERVQERTLELKTANERLEQLSELKSNFTSTVSHELRSPLCVIQEGVNIILSGCAGPVTEDQKETLLITNRNIERLIRLINNVLDLSQIESGRVPTLFDKTDLSDLVSEIHNLMKLGADRKGLRFDLNVPADKVVAVCDSDKIRQVLINLVDNAVKFTPQGGRIALSLGRDGEDVRISVEDTGGGIPAQDFEKIFGMFAQSQKSGGHRGGGVGIGLAVCRKYMELHSGGIRVESEVKKGSRFTLSFPASLPESAAAPAAARLPL